MPVVTPYEVKVYRRAVGPLDARRRRTESWDATGLEHVPCDIQPRSGQLEELPFGLGVEGTHHGFYATGLDIRTGDGLLVTSVAKPGADRFLVEQAFDWGAPGDLELALSVSDEDFDA